jgi:hypothetical protein
MRARPLKHVLTRSGVVFAILSVPFEAASAQKRTVIADSAACNACRIERRLIATLGDTIGDGSFPFAPKQIARDSRGRFYAVVSGRDITPYVFSPEGKFLQRLGRAGRGPNEYKRVVGVQTTAGDSILLFDAVNAVMNVLTSNYRLARTVRLPPNMDAVVRFGNELVLNMAISDGGRAGLPLHAFDLSGNYVKSFGAKPAVLRPDETIRLARQYAPSAAGGYWTAPKLYEYSITHWDKAGRPTQVVDRRAAWFPSFRPEKPYAITRETPPLPEITGIWEDPATGFLWVAGQHTSKQWPAGASEKQFSATGPKYLMVEDINEAADGAVEVLDIAKGRLIASSVFDDPVVTFLANGLVATRVYTENGVLRVKIWQLVLVNR